MSYKATIIEGYARLTKVFDNITSAEQWLDSYNRNHEHTTIIEVFDEAGRKIDGFFYTM